MRNTILSLAAGALLWSAAYADNSAAPVADDAKPDATLTLQGGSVAVGIGYTWGHGELSYGESSHKVSISGISVVDVGATDFSAAGTVYHLNKLSDFAGNYTAAGAGVTIAGGGTAVYLKNDHGVVIKLVATDIGLKFKLSAEGVHIELKT